MVSADQVLVDKCQRGGFADRVIALDVWHRERQVTAPEDLFIRKALDLYAQFETTLAFVTESASLGEGSLKLTKSEDLKPAFDSPAYSNLRNFIIGMREHERDQLLALGWLGQGYSGDDWSSILMRAEDYLSDDPTLHIDYLISKIGHIESGLAKRRTGQADPALDDRLDKA